MNAASPLDLINLTPLMVLTIGRPEVVVGLLDGPVAADHPDLDAERVREIDGTSHDGRGRSRGLACRHGTFVAGILCGKRGAAAPAICPGCTLLVRPIFFDDGADRQLVPTASPEQLASAVVDCVDAGARVLNLSAALVHPPSDKEERMLTAALDYAVCRGAIAVAAAGNQGSVGSTAITRHAAVIAVTACDRRGWPLPQSNLGYTVGRRGLSAPGEGIISLGMDDEVSPAGGTSVAAPFVTGAIALVWSMFPRATAGNLRKAIIHAHRQRQPTVVPPLLNAMAIHDAMADVRGGRLLG